MDVDKAYFSNLIEQKRVSLRGLAKHLGMTHSQLSLTFSGSRRMQLAEAVALSQYFGVTLNDIAYHAGIENVTKAGLRVEVIGSMGNEGRIDPVEDAVEWVVISFNASKETRAIQARTMHTPLAWMDGWVFFFIPYQSVHSDAIGRLSVCETPGGQQFIGTVRRGYKDRTFNLAGPANLESVPLKSASPILITKN